MIDTFGLYPTVIMTENFLSRGSKNLDTPGSTYAQRGQS